jgi:hypothetical protein
MYFVHNGGDANFCGFNPLNDELNHTCHLLALLGAHHIFHVSMIMVNPKIELILDLISSQNKRNQ